MKLLLFCLCIPLFFTAQDREMSFAKHLYTKGFYNDAILQLEYMRGTGKYSGYDSLDYFTALCFDKTGHRDSAISLFRGVIQSSSYFESSRFQLAILLAGKRDYSSATRTLDSLNIPDRCRNELRMYFLSAFRLLEKKTLNPASMVCKSEWMDNLRGQADILGKNRRRSAFMGGFLSALVPGLGRIYAGKPRLALPSLIPVATLGLQAWEGYRHKGFNSGRFWVFGSLATLFYIGNIYGSALSVKISKQERYDRVEQHLMLDLRLAFRDLYGKPW